MFPFFSKKREFGNDPHDIKVEFIPAEKWYKRALWRLLENYVSHNNDVIVPEGFITDGASIPFAVRWLFSPTGKYFGAAIVHDYILTSQKDWDKANSQFKQELKALEIPQWRLAIVYGSVSFRAWLHKTGISKTDFTVKN